MEPDSVFINPQGSDNVNMLARFSYLSIQLWPDGLNLLPDCVTHIWVGRKDQLLLMLVLPLQCCLPIFRLTVSAQFQQVWNIENYHYLTNWISDKFIFLQSYKLLARTWNSSAGDHCFWVIYLCNFVVFRVLQSCAKISYGRNLKFSISHEIFQVLDFLRTATCTVQYYVYN